MKTAKILGLTVSLLAAGTCLALAQAPTAPKGQPSPSTPAASPAAKTVPVKAAPVPGDEPVIVHLETRDRLVTVTRGANGLVYTVRGKDGRLIHRDLSEKQLQAKAPELFKLVKDGVANGGRQKQRKVDASLRVR